MAKEENRPDRRTTTPTVVEGYHVPVLLHESVDALVHDPDGIYVDATYGGGGHSQEILARLSDKGHLYGVDQDMDAQTNCRHLDDHRFTFLRTNFRYLPNFLNYYGVGHVDGILADLGVSSHHFDEESRGFSFRFEGPVDMRMNQQSSLTASQVILENGESALAKLLYKYGEVKNAHLVARRLKTLKPDAQGLLDMREMNEVLSNSGAGTPDKKEWARIFQALRIVVNGEIAVLESLLESAPNLLRTGGRMVVISYHSLEDRPVKNFFRTGNVSGERITDMYGVPLTQMKPVNNKPIVPTAEEIERNPRARSAKLRVAERLEDKEEA